MKTWIDHSPLLPHPNRQDIGRCLSLLGGSSVYALIVGTEDSRTLFVLESTTGSVFSVGGINKYLVSVSGLVVSVDLGALTDSVTFVGDGSEDVLCKVSLIRKLSDSSLVLRADEYIDDGVNSDADVPAGHEFIFRVYSGRILAGASTLVEE